MRFWISIFLAALLAPAIGAEEEGFVIGPRKQSVPAPDTAAASANEKKAAPAAGREWFKAGLSEKAFQAEIIQAARQLGKDDLDSPARGELLEEAIRREHERAGEAFTLCLDARKCADPLTRLGALRGIAIANPPPKTAGAALAGVALTESAEKVRAAAVDLIRQRKDPAAAAAVLKYWRSSFDDDGVLAANESTRGAAVNAMRDIGDKRVFRALLYYATLELRAGSAQLAGFDTAHIKGNGIDLPIDLPSIELHSVEGAIVVPAMASLKQASGQDFGRDLKKWNEWVDRQPDFQPRENGR